MIKRVLLAVENKSFAIFVFLDLSACFDTVSHDILLSKLYRYGIKGEPEISTKTIRIKLNSTETLQPGFAKYAVDTNLFLLGSTNSKKNSQLLDAFLFYSNCFSRIDLDPYQAGGA